MQRLADKKVDLIAVYKLDSNDELLKLLKDIQGSFSWTVRAGGKKGTLLLFLKANASVRRRVESECSNLSDYFSAHYSTPSIEKVLIPHNHRYNKELLHDLTSSYSLTNQQLTSIKNSFGVNVAFYFAFLRAYFRSLVLPALVGVGCWYTQTAFSASYALFVSVYAVAFVEYWRVQERVLSVEWGCDGARSVELANKENEARWYVREARVLLSVPVLLLFAVLLAALLTSIFLLEAFGLHFYDGPLKSYISLLPTILFCGIVPQVVAAYQPVLRWLSKWESHATNTDTEASYTLKTFTINSLVSFGGLALTAYVYVPYGNSLMQALGERVGGNLSQMELDGSRIQTQLFAYMVTSQALNAFQEVGMPFILSFVKSQTKEEYSPDDAPEEKAYLEEVREEVEKEPYDLFEDYAEMTTQFGYIALWSVAWPLAPLMGLINNFFEIRGDAFKLIRHCSRCVPRPTDSIGPWLDTLSFLAWLGALINTSLVILFNESVDERAGDVLTSHGTVLAFVAALVASHAHLLLKGFFCRLWTIAVWDGSTSAAVVRDRTLALQGSVHSVRSNDEEQLDSDLSKLNEVIADVSDKQRQSKKDQ